MVTDFTKTKSSSKRTWAILILAATSVNVAIQLLGGSVCAQPSALALPEEGGTNLRAVAIASPPAPAPVAPAIAYPCQLEYDRVTASRTQGLTEEDLKRASTYRGNRFRLGKLGETLQQWNPTKSSGSPRPLTAVVSGGSISMGHGVVDAYKYSSRLEDWLNQNYPLPSSAKKKHRVHNKSSHGADICAMAKRLNILVQELPKDVDLFVLEFAVNDYQGQDHVTQLDWKMDQFFHGFEDIALCTETVLHKLLQHYPQATILFMETRTAILQRKTASLLHMGAAQHYQVPVLSFDEALFPDYQYLLQLLKPFNYSTAAGDTVFPYPHGCHPCVSEHIHEFFRPNYCQPLCALQRISGQGPLDCDHLPPGRVPCYIPFFSHDEVHPSGIGHQIITDLIVETIASTTREVCQRQKSQQPEPGGIAAIMPTTGWMVRDTTLLDQKSAFLWVNDTYEIFTARRPLHAASHSPGFSMYEDQFGRNGWIATNSKGGESIAFDIQLPQGQCYVPYLAVLKSYENMGTFTITVLDRITQKETKTRVDGLWKPRISVPSDIPLTLDDVNVPGCTGNCQVTVATNPLVEGRGGNKVKIVTLSVRPCIQESS